MGDIESGKDLAVEMHARGGRMKLGLRRVIGVVAVVAGSCAIGLHSARAQAGGQQGPEQELPMAEDVFTNVQMLRGIPVDEFMETMGFFSASTRLSCEDCHVVESAGDWSRYADDTPRKDTARRMIAMVTAINRANFAGQRLVTCWSCHRGTNRPDVVPDLSIQYSSEPPRDPFEITASAAAAPPIDTILEKYLEALGGAQQLETFESFVIKGIYSGWDTLFQKVPIEIFVKAPDQRATIIDTFAGVDTTVYDGNAAWTAAPETRKPVSVMPLTGGNLDAARIEAELFFPSRIKEMLTEWRVGPFTTIDDRPMEMVQGRFRPDGLPVTLYFDSESGLLVRVIVYTASPVGVNPRQIDFADYRDVAGVKMPFRWTVTWTDGRSTTEVSEIEPNAAIDASRFTRPS